MISKLDKETYSTPENDAPINALKALLSQRNWTVLHVL